MAEKMTTLTAREYEVCRLLADGLENNEIAVQLRLSPHTVSSHIQKIFDKLKVRNRVEAARWYWRGRVSTLVPDA